MKRNITLLVLSGFIQMTLFSQTAIEHFEKGKELYKADKNTEAVGQFTQALAKDKNFGEAHLWRAKAQYAELDNKCSDKIIEDYTNAIELMADKFEAYAGRASAYICADDMANAEKDINKLLELKPGHYLSYSIRGYYRLQIGESEGTIKDLTKAMRLDKENDYWKNNAYYRSAAYLDKENYEAALKDLNALIKKYPGEQEFHYRKALALYYSDNDKDGLKSIEKAIALEPGDIDYLFLRGKMFYYTGKLKKAREDFLICSDKSDGSKDTYASNYRFYYTITAYNLGYELAGEDICSDFIMDVPIFTEREAFLAFFKDEENALEYTPVDYLFFLSANEETEPDMRLDAIDLAIELFKKEETLTDKGLLYYAKANALGELGKKKEACNALRQSLSLGVKMAGSMLKKMDCE